MESGICGRGGGGRGGCPWGLVRCLRRWNYNVRMTAAAQALDPGETTTRAVGIPVDEVVITEAVIAQHRRLMPPGRGYQTFVLEQAQTTEGRPDIIFVVASPRSIRWYTRSVPRLKSKAECEVISTMMTQRLASTPSAVSARLGVSERYVASVMRDMQQRGMTVDVAERISKIVRNSLVIEAKVRDWRRAIWQAHRFSGMMDMVAIAMPKDAKALIDSAYLQRIGTGLLCVDGDKTEWSVRPAKLNVSVGSRLWLTELVARSVMCAQDSEAR